MLIYISTFRILSRKIGHLFVGGQDRPFAVIKYSSVIKDLDNKIIECKFENNSWVFMRERVDKSFPNSYKTAICKYILLL
jgi:mRNA-capping enzyme